MASVYRIRNTVNSKVYIGLTVKDPVVRFREHLAAARRGEPQPLQRAIQKHGAGNFFVETIVDGLCGVDALAREVVEIAAAGSLVPAGYNGSAGGEGLAGVPKTEEFKAAVSATLTGRAKTPEHLAKISAALTGKTLSPATRAKIAAARAVQVFRPEAIERRTAKLRGRTHTAAARANMGAAQIGVPKSLEHRRSIARTMATLSDAAVRDIRLNPSGQTGKALAAKYGVSQQLICDIRKGRAYNHVREEDGAITSGTFGGPYR